MLTIGVGLGFTNAKYLKPAVFICTAAGMSYLAYYLGHFIFHAQTAVVVLTEIVAGCAVAFPLLCVCKSQAVTLLLVLFALMSGVQVGYLVTLVTLALFQWGSVTWMLIFMVLVSAVLVWRSSNAKNVVTILAFSCTSMFLIIHSFAYMFGWFPTFEETLKHLRGENEEPIGSVLFWMHIFVFTAGVAGLFVY